MSQTHIVSHVLAVTMSQGEETVELQPGISFYCNPCSDCSLINYFKYSGVSASQSAV